MLQGRDPRQEILAVIECSQERPEEKELFIQTERPIGMGRSRAVALSVMVLMSGCSDPRVSTSNPLTQVDTPPPTPTRSEKKTHKRPHNREPQSGLEILVKTMEKKIGVPIALPPVPLRRLSLKKSELFVGPPAPEGSLVWRWKNGRHLRAGYGSTSLMNCGGGLPRIVRIGGETGLAIKKLRTSAVIWPTSKDRPSAAYGLRGNWPVKTLISWARIMQEKLKRTEDRAKLSGC